MRSISLSILSIALFSLPLAADENDEIAFEEQSVCEECQEECPQHYFHHRAARPTEEEEELYREVTESHWPGKREDTLIERMTH